MPTFKQRFCSHFACPPQRFREELFARCVHRKPAIVIWLARAFETPSFLDAVALIEQAGETETDDQLEELVDDYRKHDVEGGYFTIQISGTRLLKLNSEINQSSL